MGGTSCSPNVSPNVVTVTTLLHAVVKAQVSYHTEVNI